MLAKPVILEVRSGKMPIYLFRCSKCKKEFELKYLMDAKPKEAPQVGHKNKKHRRCNGTLVRVYTPVNFKFKD